MLKVIHKRPDHYDMLEELTTADRVVRVWWPHVVFLIADGPEKDRCLAVSGLPDNGNPVMRFYGDIAKHILGNWNVQ